MQETQRRTDDTLIDFEWIEHYTQHGARPSAWSTEFAHFDGRVWAALVRRLSRANYLGSLISQGCVPIEYTATRRRDATRFVECFANVLSRDGYARVVADAASTLSHPQTGHLVTVTINYQDGSGSVEAMARTTPNGFVILPSREEISQLLLNLDPHLNVELIYPESPRPEPLRPIWGPSTVTYILPRWNPELPSTAGKEPRAIDI